MIKTKKTTPYVLLWAGSIGLVIIIGLYFLPLEYESLGFWEALYMTLRLFVFELDKPFPKSPYLIFIFFAAPLITASAVGTFITYMFRLSPSIKVLWTLDHVVICGVGRTGKLLACAFKEMGLKVVGIDLGAEEDFEEWCTENKIPMILGNFHSKHTLQKARANKARSIFFASGDDIQNLEGGIRAFEWLRNQGISGGSIWAHIANERLAATAKIAVQTEGGYGIRFFDTYRIAAEKMINKYFNREQRRGVNEVTILGFGKFGRDLMEILVADQSPDESFHIHVVDILDKKSAVYSLAEEVGVRDRVTFTRADIQEIELVNREDSAFILCTDDDLRNLTEALMLAKKVDAPHIYVRMAHWPMSTVAEHIGEDRGITFININDLLIRGIRALPGISSNSSTDLPVTGV